LRNYEYVIKRSDIVKSFSPNHVFAYWAFNLPWRIADYTKIRDGIIYAQREAEKNLEARGITSVSHRYCYVNPLHSSLSKPMPLLQFDLPCDPSLLETSSRDIKDWTCRLAALFPGVPVGYRAMWGGDHVSHEVIMNDNLSRKKHLFLLNEQIEAPYRDYGRAVDRVLRRNVFADTSNSRVRGAVSEIHFDKSVGLMDVYDAASRELSLMERRASGKVAVHAHMHIEERLSVVPVMWGDAPQDLVDRIDVIRGNILALTGNISHAAAFIENHPERRLWSAHRRKESFIKRL
jgi:hypothetical protein